MESLNLPFVTTDLSDHHDSNTMAYVAGYLIKRLKFIENYEECRANLLTDALESHHTFSMFKEDTDDKKRLTCDKRSNCRIGKNL